MSGETSDTPFDIVADVEETRGERAQEWLETVIVTPLRIIWGDLRARVGLLILIGFLLMGTVGVLVVDRPLAGDGPRLAQPLEYPFQFPLGTDNLGRGVFALIVHATPYMLKMMLAGALFTAVMGTVVGTYAGYRGGNVDRVLSTISDIVLVIPGIPLFIVISLFLSPDSPLVVGIVLAVNRWAGLARQVRSQVLSIREDSYVEASRVLGLSRTRILLKDIIPSIMPFVMIRFVNAARGVIYASVALFFLGILPASKQTWGLTMRKAYSGGNALSRPDSYHWILTPMAAVVLISLGLILFAQGTDRIFNPRVRARHEQEEAAAVAEGEEGTQTTITY